MAKAPDTPMTTYGFVGNLGCIRFPKPLRAAAGVKRGDRLMVMTNGGAGVVLEKVDLPGDVQTADVRVEGCACEQPPEACGHGPRELVGVGWSYVQLNKELATEVGFLPDTPIRLVGEPGQIAVEPCDHPAGAEVERLRCPP
jgi:bifunctional DNA-binding transcriptional regulator/antitoxin component of YhaV-PrlF toxin-antitoxin module